MNDFLATYFLHSSVLLSLILLLLQLPVLRATRIKDSILRLGLLMAVGTATFATQWPRPHFSSSVAPIAAQLSKGTPPVSVPTQSIETSVSPHVIDLPLASAWSDWGTSLFGGSLLVVASRFLLAYVQIRRARQEQITEQSILKLARGFEQEFPGWR